MNKDFIPYTEALAFKELGFDEECLTSYHYDGTLMDIWSVMGFVTNSSLKDPKNFNAYSNSKLLKDYLDNSFTAAPTFSQAFRWFREKYKLPSWVYTSNSKEFWYSVLKDGRMIVRDYKPFNTYEEAELACLRKLIEIVKNDNKSS